MPSFTTCPRANFTSCAPFLEFPLYPPFKTEGVDPLSLRYLSTSARGNETQALTSPLLVCCQWGSSGRERRGRDRPPSP